MSHVPRIHRALSRLKLSLGSIPNKPPNRPAYTKTAILALVAILLTPPTFASTATKQTLNQKPVDAVEGEFLVKFKDRPQAKIKAARLALEQQGLEHVQDFKSVSGLRLMRLSRNKGITPDLHRLRQQADIEYIEPNYRYHAQGTIANDAFFNNLWGLDNQGQTGGMTDLDINAPEAWDITLGNENVIVAVIDSGIDYTHPDLVANMWTNPGEIPKNGIDDDLNGIIDDVHGYNAILGNGDPMDDNNHGTHVAGTIGATGNNGIGITGINWHTRIIACKFLDAEGSGSTADAIRCLDYLATLKQAGVNIVASNNSWGGGGASQALAQAIQTQKEAGILFVVAAGNEGSNIDATPSYPAAYPHDNIISVAAIDHNGELADFSNYGHASVDVAAPGVGILSTIVGNRYASYDGTSMAAPHVTGVVALTKAALPELDWRDLKNRTLASGRYHDNLAGKMLTGSYVRAYDTDGYGTISCARQAVAMISPATEDITISLNDSLTLEAFVSDCEGLGEPPTFYVNGEPSGQLHDTGITPDQISNDLRFTATWSPVVHGEFQITVGEKNINVYVVEPFPEPEAVASRYQSITGTRLSLSDDEIATLSLPFAIQIGQLTMDKVQIASNGCVGQFDSLHCHHNNQPLPSSSLSAAGGALAVLWDDWNPEQGGGIYYEIVGEEPLRKLVIEWRNVSLYRNTEAIATFQVVFNEYNDDIEFNYRSLPVAGLTATVGVQPGSSLATQHSFNMAGLLYDGLTLLWHGYDDEAPTELQASIQTNQSQYSIGDRHTVVFSLLNEGDLRVVDLYIWLQLPNGSRLYVSGSQLTLVETALRSALRLRTGSRLENRTVFNRPLPALRPGDYAWNIVTVAAGNALIEANWLSQDQAPFTVTASEL